jgi:hypothetical protein
MENKKIYGAIVNVMKEIGAIGKERKNQQQGFMYRGVEDVMNALQPLLEKNGVFIVPEVVEHTREDRVSWKGNPLIYSIMKIRHHFIAEDGSEIVSTTIGEGMDSADKASNKAMSIAFKYACFQVFCIPTEEMQDPDAETPPSSRKKENEGGRHTTNANSEARNQPKTNDTAKTFQPLTRSEMVEKWGVKSAEGVVAYFEKEFGKKLEEFDECETDAARVFLEKKKQEREAKERQERYKNANGDSPFPED